MADIKAKNEKLLKTAITKKLRKTLGEQDVDILTEYVWHMVSTDGIDTTFLTTELTEFLSDQTASFVDWLVAYIQPYINSSVLYEPNEKEQEVINDAGPIRKTYSKNDRKNVNECQRRDDRGRMLGLAVKDANVDATRRSKSRHGQEEYDDGNRKRGRVYRDISSSRKKGVELTEFSATQNRKQVDHQSDDYHQMEDDSKASKKQRVVLRPNTNRDNQNQRTAAHVEGSFTGEGPVEQVFFHPQKVRGLSFFPVRPCEQRGFSSHFPGRGYGPPFLQRNYPIMMPHRPFIPPPPPSSGSMPALDQPLEAVGPKTLVKCSKWPNCSFGDSCRFVHPREKCVNWPKCNWGSACFYIHPEVPCKFGAMCRDTSCNYQHPSTENEVSGSFGMFKNKTLFLVNGNQLNTKGTEESQVTQNNDEDATGKISLTMPKTPPHLVEENPLE